MDFVEGIWREFLDPYGASDDTRAQPAHRVPAPLRKPTSRSPGHLLDLLSRTRGLSRKAARGARTSLEAADVDLQPVGGGSPKVHASAAWVSGSPEDLRTMEEDWGTPLPAMEPPKTGRWAQGRARVSQLPLRLGNERDGGPTLSLSKRKLELLLAEPEKRQKQRVA